LFCLFTYYFLFLQCISECGQQYAEEVEHFLDKTGYLSTNENFEISNQVRDYLIIVEVLRQIPGCTMKKWLSDY
jgi:hypothetical protein